MDYAENCGYRYRNYGNNKCLTTNGRLLSTETCDPNNLQQRWAFDRNNRLINNDGLCLNYGVGGVNVEDCRLKQEHQWIFENNKLIPYIIVGGSNVVLDWNGYGNLLIFL